MTRGLGGRHVPSEDTFEEPEKTANETVSESCNNEACWAASATVRFMGAPLWVLGCSQRFGKEQGRACVGVSE